MPSLDLPGGSLDMQEGARLSADLGIPSEEPEEVITGEGGPGLAATPMTRTTFLIDEG